MEVENMLKDFEQRLAYQGLNLEQYFKMMGKTEEEVKKNMNLKQLKELNQD